MVDRLRVVVVGGTGYLGAVVGRKLAARHRVVVAARRRPTGSEHWARNLAGFEAADVTRPDGVRRVARIDADVFIYCVSLDHRASAASIDHAWEVNVAPVWHLLHRLSESGRRTRFVYLSTSQVYGPLSGTVDERSETDPRNHYALTHLLAETATSRYRAVPGIKIVNVRVSNGYGAPIFSDANCWWLVANDLCRSAMQEYEIRLTSDGTPLRDFIHVEDVAAGIEVLVEAPDAQLRHEVYNLGSGSTVSILELSRRIAEIHELKYGRRVPVRLVHGEAPVTTAPTMQESRFRFLSERVRELGYRPTITLDEGISMLFDYLEESGRPT